MRILSSFGGMSILCFALSILFLLRSFPCVYPEILSLRSSTTNKRFLLSRPVRRAHRSLRYSRDRLRPPILSRRLHCCVDLLRMRLQLGVAEAATVLEGRLLRREALANVKRNIARRGRGSLLVVQVVVVVAAVVAMLVAVVKGTERTRVTDQARMGVE